VALAQSGLSPIEFERRYRESLQIEQFQNSIENSAFVTKAQLESAVAVRDQQREIAYLKLSAAKFLNQAPVSDQDVAGYYKAHGADFMTPEKVSLAYVELDEAQLAKSVTADDAALQAEYQQHLANYTQAEARRAQHILIAVKGGDPKLDAAAKAKADDLLKQIQAGTDFSTLAAKNSDDPGSAKSGGDLGWVEHGVMVKPFEEALFAIKKPGDVVGPVRTQFGYHLIKLVEVRAPQVKSFAEVKQQIAADFQKKKADDEYFGMGDKLANLAYEHPNSLDEVSKELNLQVQTVDDVTRDAGTGIAANSDVRKAGFSDQVLGQGNNSEPIQIGPNHAVVVRVKGHVSAEPKPLDQVRAQIVTLLKQQYAAQQTQKLADSLVKALQQGQDPSQLAKSDGAVFTAARFVGPQDTGLPQTVSMAAFAAPQPAAGGRTVGSAALSGGDLAVYLLTAVTPGTTAGMNEQQTTAESRALGRVVGSSDFAAYLAYLHRDAKIKINTANIEPQDQ
jgi:peptidyl-prolyl cis-trans isomerase D